ncbi:uncharacterized protein LOC127719764 isoform X6 [Mytilus californianus]|uniref:uncharacterized protein LOC127719764 isoform X6 n=1 Tax=Mytilus californianus TaxID=6549 RepID=UPI002247C1FF|nr:uncharacterized protein LOC127719764 isoform X6 [Mytilus californianus]
MSNAVTSQPGQEKSGFNGTGAAPPLGCPPGLEYLAQMNEVYLNQKVDLLEIWTNTALVVPNRYSVENSSGQRAYFSQEESEYCNRICCGPNRGFQMHITMNDGREVIRCEREFKCCAGCCWCANGDHCGWEMTVEAPPGNLIGYIRQNGSKWKMNLTLYDANRQKLYDIWSKCCPIFCICCIDDINFYVHDAKSGNKLSPRIYRKWATTDLLVCESQGKRDCTAPPLGCPPGLEYLAQMDEIYLNKQYDEPESLSRIKFKNPNRYSVENNRGKRKYFAEEESNFCNRISCESYRGFIMHISTNNDTEVIRCERKFKCCAGCCWFADCDNCWWEMTVEAPPGILIGYIRQRGSKWKTHLTLYDANRPKLYDIWSKCCSIFCICCIDDINFYETY